MGMVVRQSSWQNIIGVVTVAIAQGCWCAEPATLADCRADPSTCQIASDSLLQVASAAQSKKEGIVEDAVEDDPALRAIWTGVLSLDPDCQTEELTELFEMYTAAVKSLFDHENHRTFAPFLLTHLPPEFTLQDLALKTRSQLASLEDMGVTVVPFTSTFYGPRQTAYILSDEDDASRWRCAVGTYARIDVPQVLIDNRVFQSGHYNTTHVLHTDVDVLWLDSVTQEDWWAMAPKNGCPLSMSYDMKPERVQPHMDLNGGVLVMEITKFVELAPVLLEQAIKDRFVFKAYDQSLFNDVLAEDPPNCATLLSAAWNYKPWWGMHTVEVRDGHSVPVSPRLLHLQGLHPSSGLICAAMLATHHRVDCDVDVNASIGMMAGAEIIQKVMDDMYKENGYEMLLQALVYYYRMLGKQISDV
mmetsp:Transcript_15066/g.34300  ORF Transcript_15066/g.34300 Transcript_15066/m.34300 type:complete len:416 (+) Transcript_15066:24-1271(+)